jgi:hypothetical protein
MKMMETIVDVRRSARRPSSSRRLHERLERRLARLFEYEERRWPAEPSAAKAILATRRALQRVEFARRTGWRAIEPEALMRVPTVAVAPGVQLARVVCQPLDRADIEARSGWLGGGRPYVAYTHPWCPLPGAWDGKTPFRYRSHLPSPMPARVRRLANEVDERRSLKVIYEASWVEVPAVDPILCVHAHDLLWVVGSWETSAIERWLLSEWADD